MSTGKRMEMERLSPILLLGQNHTKVGTTGNTTRDCTTPKLPYKRRKDMYAIELSSSPEIELQQVHPVKCPSQKRTPHGYRTKCKSTSKKLISTPLSNVITKKTLVTPIRNSPCSFESDADKSLVLHDVPSYDSPTTFPHLNESPANAEDVHIIDTFSSPQKPLRKEVCTPNISFPRIPPSDPPNSSPYLSVISKKPTNHNRSLNDSLLILSDAVDDLDEPECGIEISNEQSQESDLIPSSIECFESPNQKSSSKLLKPLKTTNDKLQSNFQKQSTVFQSVNSFQCSNISIVGSSQPQSSKINLKFPKPGQRKRKRVLDFNSHIFADAVQMETIQEEDVIKDADVFPLDLKEVNKESLEMQLETPGPSSPSIIMADEDDDSADSIIEGTPNKPHTMPPYRDKIDKLSGFTMCSSLKTQVDTSGILPNEKISGAFHSQPRDHFSPSAVDICNKAPNDAFPIKHHSELKFVVASHDSSDDDSPEHVVDIEEVKDTAHLEEIRNLPLEIHSDHSPEVCYDATKRSIQTCQTPSKVLKPFSEAADIGAFCSPDSNASINNDTCHEESIHVDEEIANTTTTVDEEFVDESEQVQPRKRRKKGTLLEQAGTVISRIEASRSLFDYEIKKCIRPNSGRYVSTPLVICKKWETEKSSYFLICKSLRRCREAYGDYSSLLGVIVNNVQINLTEGDVVIVHFPIKIMFCDTLNIPYVFAGNQIVLNVPESHISDAQVFNVDGVLSQMCDPLTDLSAKTPISMRLFASNNIKCFEEAALCQGLVEDIMFNVRILHVLRSYVNSTKKLLILCSDDEKKVGWISFTIERDMRRVSALETLLVLHDGSHVQIKGFNISDRSYLDNCTKYLVKYCSNGEIYDNAIFTIIPVEITWIISSLGEPKKTNKNPTTIPTILEERIPGKRYLVDISSVIEEEEAKLILKQSSGDSISFIQGVNAPKIPSDLYLTPIFLDAVYFDDNKLYSDEYTKILTKIC